MLYFINSCDKLSNLLFIRFKIVFKDFHLFSNPILYFTLKIMQSIVQLFTIIFLTDFESLIELV